MRSAMAEELVAQLRGAAPEREAAYARLLQLEAEHFNANGGSSGSVVAEIAVACASPLCEVLCKAVSEVDVAEWNRAAQVLTAPTGVDPAHVGGETQCWKPDQCNRSKVWLAPPESVLGVGESAYVYLLDLQLTVTTAVLLLLTLCPARSLLGEPL